MKFSKFIVIPMIVAFLAFTIQILDQLIAGYMPIAGNVGFGWVSFIAWAMYFMAGCTLQGGEKVFNGYLSGIVASVLIMELGGVFAGLGFFAVPVAIFVVVIGCICLERVPHFDFVPALFVGAGTFFGIMSYVDGATYLTATVVELIYCLIGLVYGWVTIALRSRYEAYVENHSHAGPTVPHH